MSDAVAALLRHHQTSTLRYKTDQDRLERSQQRMVLLATQQHKSEQHVAKVLGNVVRAELACKHATTGYKAVATPTLLPRPRSPTTRKP